MSISYGVKFIYEFLSDKLGIRVAKQIIYITLLVFGVERKKIREIFGASDVTHCKYSAALENEDLASIFEQNYNRPQSELENFRQQIEQEFAASPPATRREAAIKIEKMTGIKRSLPRVGKFLKKGASKVVQ